MTTDSHPADRLCAAMDRVGSPLCVGIDPVFEKLPESLRVDVPLNACNVFCRGVIDAVKDVASTVKFQSACFERYGAKGVSLLGDLKGYAHNAGFQIVLDVKRGDIGISAAHYAEAATVDGPVDWVTVNPYLGTDSILPFLESGLGVFCLVRTSNPSGDVLQSQQLQDGRIVYEAVADLLSDEGANWVGDFGWSALGVVVGATKPKEAIALRSRLQNQIFLMPGVGAQGATIDDIEPCVANGHGALIPLSRSILYPEQQTGDWQSDIANAAQSFSKALRGGANA